MAGIDTHNERVKLVTALLATIGIAMLLFGFLQPIILETTGNPKWLVAGAILWILGFINLANLRSKDV